MPEIEKWVPIAEFPHYLVSSYGRVKHVDRREPRKISANERGFVVILLSSKTTSTRYLRQVNKLVARAFLDSPEYDTDTALWHLDGDLSNCRADNLRWEMRGRVLEWNEMHRRGEPQYRTPLVKNNATGTIYANAYECGMAEGLLETKVLWMIERAAPHWEDDESPFRYVFS